MDHDVEVETRREGLHASITWTAIASVFGGMLVAGFGLQQLTLSNRSRISWAEREIDQVQQQQTAHQSVHTDLDLRLRNLEKLTANGVPPDWLVKELHELEARLAKLEERNGIR